MSLPFVLASASVARRKLLQTVGIEPIVRVSNFDESTIAAEDTLNLVKTLAQCKAQTIAPHFKDALILGCDSVLEVAGEVHGKPKDKEEAFERWLKMRGRAGTLYTGHALIDRASSRTLTDCGITRVHFADVDDDEIRAYIDTGEPLNCAGCFALEGKGSVFVEKIEGCHTNVIGLSLPLLRKMLAELGYRITDFWL